MRPPTRSGSFFPHGLARSWSGSSTPGETSSEAHALLEACEMSRLWPTGVLDDLTLE